MIIDGENVRPIWLDKDSNVVKIIDQRFLPHKFITFDLKTVDDVIIAIKDMYVRGAPLIGVTAAWGMYIAAINCNLDTIDDLIGITTASVDALELLFVSKKVNCYC